MTGGGSRTDWFHAAKWGVFMHFLAAPASSSQGAETDAATWNRRVDAFDVEGAARQLREVGARYFILTLGQNSGHYCAPNAAYDRITGISPSKCSRRDLVSELHAALAPHGIRLMVYFTAGAPEYEPVAVAKLRWTKGGRCAEFQRKWEAVIRDWSLRWGEKVSGWWFDGCYYNEDMYEHAEAPNFASFAAAVRAGNPDSLIGWNPGVKYPPYTVDPAEDYTAGEVNDPEAVDAPGRWVRQAQFHILTYLGKSWGQLPIRFSATEAIEHTLAFTNYGGVVTWDMPLTYDGLIHPDAFPILKAVGQAVDATRSRADLEPPKTVRPTVTFLEVPTSGTGKNSGKIRLTLKNSWPERIGGHVDLTVEPAAFAEFAGNRRIGYDLQPGAENRTEVPFCLNAAAADGPPARIVVTRSGDGRSLFYRVPRRERLGRPRLQDVPALEELGGALATVPSRMIITEQGRGLADVKLAIAGGHLAIYSRVSDGILRQAPGVWDGSCMEVFGIAEPGDRINQLFFVPATAHQPAKAMKLIPAAHHSKIAIVPAPELRFASWPTAGGYTSAALIPLAWWLQRPTPPELFYFEIVVSAGLDSITFGRAAMFGNLGASNCSDNYAEAGCATS